MSWLQRLRKWILAGRQGKPAVFTLPSADERVCQAARLRYQQLTPRQRQVARLVCQGYSNRQIAETLVVSPETVKTHLRHIRAQFGARSKAHLRKMLCACLDKPDPTVPPPCRPG